MSALDSRVSVFERVDRPGGPREDTTLRAVLGKIRDGAHAEAVAAVRAARAPDERRALKRRVLPALTPSGLFLRREAGGLEAHSGLVVLDVDDAADLGGLTGYFAARPEVAALFVSPSGNGLKVFVLVAVEDPETGERRPPRDDAEHKAAWACVASLYAGGPAADAIDPSGKDVARACYLSHDPDAYVNGDAEPVVVRLPPPGPAALPGPTLEGGPSDPARVESALAHVARAGRLPYGEWVRLIAAVLDAVGGDAARAESLLVWHVGEEAPGEYAAKLRRPLERVTAGTLFHMALEAGWEPPTAPRRERHASQPAGWLRDRRRATPHEPAATGAKPLSVCVADVEAEAVRWMWDGRLSAGKVHLLEGDPGTGKSTVYCSLAACVTAGVPWPDGAPTPPSARGGVVIVTAEDDVATTIRPRLEAAGADITRVSVVSLVPTPNGAGRMPTLPEDVDLLVGECERVGARLLLLDPVTAYLGDTNSHRDSDVRGALAPLAEAAERAGVAVVLVRHLNKGAGSSALYRGGGSIAFAGLARVVLLAGRVPDDPERRALAVTKNNLAPFAPTLGYHLESAGPFGVGRAAWHGPVPLTADDLVRPPSGPANSPAQDEAADFLADALSRGDRRARELYAEAEAGGISERTLKRAKARLGVEAEQRVADDGDRAWWWTLPGGQGAKHPDAGPLPPHAGDGAAGTAPHRAESPQGADPVAPWEDGAPCPDRGPLPQAEGLRPGQAVSTPHGVGTVTSAAECGRVSVDVDGLPVSFPLDAVTTPRGRPEAFHLNSERGGTPD